MDCSQTLSGVNLGSAVVGMQDVKLYNFCKTSIGSYSRRELREFFKNGNIYVNGIRIRKGHDDETLRLSLGDIVCLKIVEDEPTVELETDQSRLDLILEGEGYCVFNKPCGCSVTTGKEYEVAIRRQMWGGKYSDTSTLLYRLEKSISGLCIATQTHEHLVRLRRALATTTDVPPELTLTYQAVVCGRVGAAGETVTLTTNYPDCPALSVHVIQVAHCRSANFLSLVNVTPIFTHHDMGLDDVGTYELFESEAPVGFDKSDRLTTAFLNTLQNPITNADNKLFNHPTRMLKSLRCALMYAGHGIVGDKDLVKKSKGLYAALTAVTFSGSLAKETTLFKEVNASSTATIIRNGNNVCITLSTPARFVKLMEREVRMWRTAHERDQATLAEHLSRVNANSTALEASTFESSSVLGEEENDQSGSEFGGVLIPTVPSKNASVSPVASVGCTGAVIDLPVEYQTGEALFCGRRFHVSPSVMIPRRSSEALVKEAVRLVANREYNSEDGVQSMRVLDLGTGSGCLLLSTVLELQSALPTAEVSGVGLDISVDALRIANANVAKLELNAQVSLIEGSFETMRESLSQHRHTCGESSAGKRQSFDIIMCNPPYSSVKERSRLSAACRAHEPALALFAPRHTHVDTEGGAEEGTMGAYYMVARSLGAMHQHDSLLRQALQENKDVASTQVSECNSTLSRVETPLISLGAHLILEMGHGQESVVKRIISTGAQGWVYLHSVKDHKGLVRCVVFQYRGEEASL